MENQDEIDKNTFLYPRSRYYGNFTPEILAFNANLQELAQKVNFISNLHTAGKLSTEQATQQLNSLWEQFSRAKETLKIS